MNIESILRNIYHKIHLRKLKNEEEKEWENILHGNACKSLKDNQNQNKIEKD